MALTISYNQDGSVTVKSGDEQVTIATHAPAAPGNPAGEPTPIFIVPPPAPPQPAHPPAPQTPPIIVGPPPPGPRIMILAPGHGSISVDPVFWSIAEPTVAMREVPCLIRRGRTSVDLAIACNQSIELRTLLNSAKGDDDEPLALRVWRLPSTSTSDY